MALTESLQAFGDSCTKALLATETCCDESVERRAALVGAMRATHLLHSLVRAPRQFQREVDASTLVRSACVGMQRDAGACSVRDDCDQLLAGHERVALQTETT